MVEKRHDWRPPWSTFLEHGGKDESKKYVDEVYIRGVPDEEPDVSWLERTPEFYMADGVPREEAERYADQDKKRLAAFYNGDWWMIGIYAEAKVYINDTRQKIRSGGLWGIESDSDERHIRETAKEQVAELDDTLEAMGFAKDPIELTDVDIQM